MTQGKIRKIVKLLSYLTLGLFFLYVLLGVLGVPLGITWALRHKFPEHLQARAQVQRVGFNPFLFRLTLSHLEVLDVHGARLLGLEELDLDVSFLALLKKAVHLERVELTGLYLHPVMSAQGQLNFLSLLPEPEQPSGPSSSPEATAAPEPPATQDQEPVHVIVDAFQLKSATLHVEDHAPRHPFEHVFRPIQVSLQNVDTVLNAGSDFSCRVTTLDGGKVSLDGHFQIEPFKLLLDIKMEQVPIQAARSYIQDVYALDVAGGGVNLYGRLLYDATPGIPEAMTFQGDLNIPDLQLKDTGKDTELLAWDHLHVAPIDFQLSNKRLLIGSVRFDGLRGRVALEPDGNNISRILNASQQAEDPQEHKSEQDVSPSDLPPEALEPEPPAGPDEEMEAFLVKIEEFLLSKGTLTFVDETLEESFRVKMADLDLKVTGISTRKHSRMEYQLNGQFAGQGDLDIRGSVRPFVQPLELELAVKLNNYEMLPLTPYVGKFTGMTVGDGRFNVQVDYRIQQDELTAGHKVLIDKFAFGDKVESDEALNLPFKLALSLLKDVKGQIRLDLPVSGRLSDPEFRYMPMVGRTLKNLLLKVVTKPFTFLASVIGAEGGEEEFSYIRFMPGSSEISPAEKHKLQNIARAFKERPSLGLKIHGVYDSEDDWWAIKAANFNREFQAIQDESKRTVEQLLIQYYRKVFGIPAFRRIWADYQAGLKTIPPKMTEKQFYIELKRQLIKNAPADRKALERLAQDRAQAVVRIFTVESGIPQERARIGAPHEAKASLGTIPLELTLIAEAESAAEE